MPVRWIHLGRGDVHPTLDALALSRIQIATVQDRQVVKVAQLPALVRTYRRLANSAQSENQLRELHIRLDTMMTPSERRSLIEWRHLIEDDGVGLEERFSIRHHWLNRLENHDQLVPFEGGLGYQREIRQRAVTFYRHGPEPASGLLVGFSGLAGRLMMPSADFLSFLGGHRRDLLLFAPSSEVGYRRGVPGFGSTLSQAIDRIGEFASRNGYRRLDTVGTSAGTLPAILSGAVLGARTVTAVGASDPTKLDPTVSLQLLESKWPSRRVPWEIFAKKIGPHLSLTSGELWERDKVNAHIIGRRIPAQHIVVPGAKHLSLWPLVTHGAFESWLSYCLQPRRRGLKDLNSQLARMAKDM